MLVEDVIGKWRELPTAGRKVLLYLVIILLFWSTATIIRMEYVRGNNSEYSIEIMVEQKIIGEYIFAHKILPNTVLCVVYPSDLILFIYQD